MIRIYFPKTHTSRPLWSLMAVAAVLMAGLMAGCLPAHAQRAGDGEAVATDAQPIAFALPVDCTIGRDCFIQQYTDTDPSSPGSSDYRCGAQVYDGHKGLDIRVVNTAALERAVPVLAAADGRVLRRRDGLADRVLKGGEIDLNDPQACGNGVVIDHGDGWETQYCHLRQGSIAVRPGQTVTAGTRIGAIGASGQAQFPHVHFGVRHNGTVISPFLARPAAEGCMADAPDTDAPADLWTNAARTALAYRDGEIIEVGFTDRAVTPEMGEQGGLPQPRPSSKALVAFVRLINLKAGDRIVVALRGPEGFNVRNLSEPLERTKARFTIYAGKRLRAAAWPSGAYRAVAGIVRGGEVVQQAGATLVLGPT